MACKGNRARWAANPLKLSDAPIGFAERAAADARSPPGVHGRPPAPATVFAAHSAANRVT